MSISYYENNADKYIKDTFKVDMSHLYTSFIKYLPVGGKVLDIGCGSGRDSKWFDEQGYVVYAHDGSCEMVNYTKAFIGERVKVCEFEAFDSLQLYGESIQFDGLWACSSLLHVEEENLKRVIENYLNYLKPEGVFFMSFKRREGNYVKDGRIFTNFTRKKLLAFIGEIHRVEIVEVIETGDVRVGREDEGWISVVVRVKE